MMNNQQNLIDKSDSSKRIISPEYVDQVELLNSSKRRKISEDSEGYKGFTAILSHHGPRKNNALIGTGNCSDKSVCRYVKPLQSGFTKTVVSNNTKSLPDSIQSTSRPSNLNTNDALRNECFNNTTDKLGILTKTAEAHNNIPYYAYNPTVTPTKVVTTGIGGNSTSHSAAVCTSANIDTFETKSSFIPEVTTVSVAVNKHENSKTKQISYTPNVPMNKEQLTAWRREARRVRNRQSAAASRQKIRDRIEELECQVDSWKKKYSDAISKVEKLEQLVKQRFSSYSRN